MLNDVFRVFHWLCIPGGQLGTCCAGCRLVVPSVQEIRGRSRSNCFGSTGAIPLLTHCTMGVTAPGDGNPWPKLTQG